MIWDTERLKVTLRQDESSTEHTIIDSAGEYRHVCDLCFKCHSSEDRALQSKSIRKWE